MGWIRRLCATASGTELWDSIEDLSEEVWPECNLHGETLNHYWAQLYAVFSEWQFVLYDPGDRTVLAEGHTIPLAWDGTDADLGPGIDATLASTFRLRAGRAADRDQRAGGRDPAASPGQALVGRAADRHGRPGARSGT